MSIWQPRRSKSYPLDLDGGERQVRFKTGTDLFPYPYLIGAISGFLPQMDWRVWGQAFGKPAFGPIAQPFPVNVTDQITIPGLGKMYSPTSGST